MKTLIINGSPRVSGDTVSLINRLSENLSGEYRIINTYTCNISPCVDCRYCKTHAGCAIRDDMQEVYKYIEECDNIVIASPVYFSEVTGKLLDFASRLQTYFCARFFRKEVPVAKAKKGAVILVGGGAGRIDRAYDTACILLKSMNCKEIYPLVSSHNTDNVPAIDDGECVSGVDNIAKFFG